MGQRERRGTSGAARPVNRHAAAAKFYLLFQGARNSHVISIASEERAVLAHRNSIHGSNFLSQWFHGVKMRKDFFLVWQSHAESPHAKIRHRLQKILQVFHQERQIHRIFPSRNVTGVV